jgi:outer membrane lipoprotein-sorting protein
MTLLIFLTLHFIDIEYIMKYGLGLCLVVKMMLSNSFDMHAQNLNEVFAQQMHKTTSVTSQFKQTKNMKLLKEKITSTGIFYYKKDNKVRIEYQHPYNYLVVLNNGQMYIKDNFGKVNQINTKNSQLLKAVNSIMIDCMNGNILNNKEFNASTTQTDKQYLVHLVPVSAEMKKMYNNIDVVFDKKALHVVQVKMAEISGDETLMEYFDTKTNTAVDDKLFKIK